MSKSLRELYLEWLAEQIIPGHRRSSDQEYSGLMRILFVREFVWFVPNDDNRIFDALELRGEFIQFIEDTGLAPLPGQINEGANILEVIVALSRRLAFVGAGTAEGWAWQLIENLGLHRMKDPIGARREAKIMEILDDLVFRSYEPDGQGGFFPLAFTEIDQRRVEIWDQMSEYINENPGF